MPLPGVFFPDAFLIAASPRRTKRRIGLADRAGSRSRAGWRRSCWLTAPGGGPSLARVTGQPGCGGKAMQWKTPVIVEIAVGLEINAYACAEI
jgi:coenzyme PQQ precursor peptide PqqA